MNKTTKYLLFLVLIPNFAFADYLICANKNYYHGTYIEISNSGVAQFQADNGHRILFSFADCHVERE